MKKSTSLLLIAAMNLRLAVTAITPLFTLIQQQLGLNNAIMSLLITIPLLCFAGGALFAPHYLQMHRLKTVLQVMTGLLIIASLIRPYNTSTLLGGTLLTSLAIAILNITVPTMIAQSTKTKVTQLTSYYSATMNIVAAIGTALAIPLATWLGWRLVICFFAIPAVIAWFSTFWLSPTTATTPHQKTSTTPNLWIVFTHDRIARHLALLMGLQSLTFYTLATWLPAIYQASGATAATAGMLASIFQLVGVPAALLLTILPNSRQKWWLLLAGYTLGLTSMAWSGIGWWLSAGILGFTCALMFSVALNQIATSSSHPDVITSRSALAQSLGYLLAAVGPILIGQGQSLMHSWLPALFALGVLMLATIFVGQQLDKMN